MTSLGIDENIEAALAYLFGIVSGIAVLIFEKNSRFVRFHAAQSIMLFLGYLILKVLVSISLLPFFLIPGAGVWLAAVIDRLVNALFLVAWVVCMVKALMGDLFRLPVLGDIAEKIV